MYEFRERQEPLAIPRRFWQISNMTTTGRAKLWQEKLHALLPLSRAMEIHVSEVSDGRLAIRASLIPNSNDKGTGFGGSIAALGIMAGWCAVSEMLEGQGLDADVVIQRAETDYLAPAT